MAAMIAAAKKKWGRIDILHYNVGVSIAGGDASPTEITEAAFDRVVDVHAHAARAELNRRLGRTSEAHVAYQRALQLTKQAAERRFIEKRLASLR